MHPYMYDTGSVSYSERFGVYDKQDMGSQYGSRMVLTMHDGVSGCKVNVG